MRNLFRAVDILPAFYFLGGVVAFLNSKFQRLGDIAANTIVVRTPRVYSPDIERISTGKYNSLRNYPHLVARLRQAVTPAEAALALRAVLRRADLDPDARVALFRQLAEHFRNRVAFPEEGVETLSDERYVRNVVELLYAGE